MLVALPVHLGFQLAVPIGSNTRRINFQVIILRFVKDMQGAHNELRSSLWKNLKTIYDRYAEANGEIPTSKVEEIVVDVLGETTQQEIDYVVKNMFRLDADGSGHVDFLEFVLFNLFRETFCSRDIADK